MASSCAWGRPSISKTSRCSHCAHNLSPLISNAKLVCISVCDNYCLLHFVLSSINDRKKNLDRLRKCWPNLELLLEHRPRSDFRYGKGYALIIRCADDAKEEVKTFMGERLSASKLTEEHYNQLRYEIPQARLSSVLKEIEKAKSRRIVVDYSVSQTTLEDVSSTY